MLLHCSVGWLSRGKVLLTFVVVVVIRPIPRDGGMAEDHGAPGAGQLHKAWTGDCKKRERVAKELAAQIVCSWTVQNEMRGVLGRVSASAAGKIFDSANPEEIKT